MIKGVIVYLANTIASGRLSLLLQSLALLEKHFNEKYQYPVIIFHEDFTQLEESLILNQSSSHITFVHLPNFLKLPPGLNEDQVGRWIQGLEGARKGAPLGYRQMCRFYAYGLLVHPALNPYEYYWRFDDDSFLTAPVEYDPFALMKEKKILYGYRSIATENPKSPEGIGLRELWQLTKKFAKANHLSLKQVRKRCIDWKGRYKGTYYYNNFEISSIPFWRNHPLFHTYFQLLESTLGFFKYRWGDANVRTFLCNLLLQPEQIHHFADISYRHNDHYSLLGSEKIQYIKESDYS